MTRINTRIAVFIAGILLSAVPAFADSLDGDWCSLAGEKLTIEGDDIIAPDGVRTTGNYARHQFTFSAPDGTWHGGHSILLQQHSEDHMSLFVQGGNTASGEEWRRCRATG